MGRLRSAAHWVCYRNNMSLAILIGVYSHAGYFIAPSTHVFQGIAEKTPRVCVSAPDGQCKFPRLWPPQTPPGKDVGIMTVRR